jgi:hypothetical protein
LLLLELLEELRLEELLFVVLLELELVFEAAVELLEDEELLELDELESIS